MSKLQRDLNSPAALIMALWFATATVAAFAGNSISGYPVGATSSWDASAGVAPASNFATLDTRGIHHVLDCDAGTDETAYFRGVVPVSYGGGNITVEVHWMMTSATSGTLATKIRGENLGANGLDLDTTSWDSYNYSSETVNGTSGKVFVESFTLAASDLDTFTAGDAFVWEIGRDADDTGGGGDSATGDAELLRVLVDWAP